MALGVVWFEIRVAVWLCGCVYCCVLFTCAVHLTENFYEGNSTPYGRPHTLSSHTAQKSYDEILDNFTPKENGKVCVGAWVSGIHKNKRKRFAGEVLSIHTPESAEPYIKVRNVRTGKSRMMLLSLARKCHSVNAFIRAVHFFVLVCLCMFICACLSVYFFSNTCLFFACSAREIIAGTRSCGTRTCTHT